MKTKIISLSIVAAIVRISFALDINGVSITNALCVTSCLMQFGYSDTNISSSAECNFYDRKNVISRVLEEETLCRSTNVLYAIADYLALGRPIPVDNYIVEFKAAYKQDMFEMFGDSNYVVRAGSPNFAGPVARACRQQYAFRRAYNSDLRYFRTFCLERVFDKLCSPPWTEVPVAERNAIWAEFRRRVDPLEKEIQGIPLVIGAE